MISSLIIAASLQQKTFDFDHPAAPAPVIVEALGEQIGVNMRANGNLDKDILIIHLDGATQQQAMEWIAHVVEGEWKEQRGTLYLSRSAETERRQEAELRQQVLQHFRDYQESVKVAKPLTKGDAETLAAILRPAMRDPYKRIRVDPSLTERIASRRLLALLIKGFDISQLLDMPHDVPVYLPFTESTADQRLPKNALSIVRDFLAENALYADAMRAAGVDLSRHGVHYTEAPGWWAPGEFHGALQVANRWSSPSFMLYLPTARGGARYFGIGVGIDVENRYPSPLQFDEWAVEPELSEVAQDYVALPRVAAFVPLNSRYPVPARLLEAVKSPDFDLFMFGGYDLLVQAAKAIDRSLVVCLADSSATWSRRIQFVPDEQLDDLMLRMLHPSVVDATVDEDVILARPRDPAKVRRDRIPRDLFRRIILDGLEGKSGLEYYVELLSDAPLGVNVFDPRGRTKLITRMTVFAGRRDQSINALRLYGVLSPAQQNIAAQGGVMIPWQYLGQREREVWSAVATSKAMLGYPGVIAFVGANAEEEHRLHGVLEKSVTEGRTPVALIVRRTDSQAVVAGSDDRPNVPIHLIDFNSLPYHVANFELGFGSWGSIDRYVARPLTTIEVLLKIGDDEVPLASYSESYVFEGQEFGDFSQIPPSIYEHMRDDIERIKKQTQNPPPN